LKTVDGAKLAGNVSESDEETRIALNQMPVMEKIERTESKMM